MVDKIKILLVDDQPFFRKEILKYLAEYDIISVGEASNGNECLELLKLIQPDVIVLDLQMPEMNGNDTFDNIRSYYPHFKVLILSRHHEEGMIDNFIHRGVKGYLSKDHVSDKPEILAEGIKAIKSNETFFYSYNPKNSIKYTKRETEVIIRLLECKSSKEIGNELKIDEKQVNRHRNNLYRKTKTRNGIEFIKYGLEKGLEFLGKK